MISFRSLMVCSLWLLFLWPKFDVSWWMGRLNKSDHMWYVRCFGESLLMMHDTTASSTCRTSSIRIFAGVLNLQTQTWGVNDRSSFGLLSDQRILSSEAVDSFDAGRGHWWQLGLMTLTHLKALSHMRHVSWEIYSRLHHEYWCL